MAKCVMTQETLSYILNIDLTNLHKAKVAMGAISKDTPIKDSLMMDIGELDMKIESVICEYFNDYGKDILIGRDSDG